MEEAVGEPAFPWSVVGFRPALLSEDEVPSSTDDEAEAVTGEELDFVKIFGSALDRLRTRPTTPLIRTCTNFIVSMAPPGRGDLSDVGDLEVVFQCVQEREQDFRMASSLGLTLVERNQQLQERLSEVEQEWEVKVSRLSYPPLPRASLIRYQLQEELKENAALLEALDVLEEEKKQLIELNDRSQALVKELNNVRIFRITLLLKYK